MLGKLHSTGPGFLWTAIKNSNGKDDESSPYFWTDLKDLITVYEQSENGSDIRILKQDDPGFEEYYQSHNRQDIVMARISNNTEKYKELIGIGIDIEVDYAKKKDRMLEDKTRPPKSLPDHQA